ncbi:DUF4229 domain-containing protein [Kineosporia succinea]|uniref:MnhB-related membrane protein n=1 Tax=Kineosporia succinea TaxID=84632 RepID=A0ABT9P329_9ACTN|nr:DUF4229 domain-containing protein [Kineosporia succinea]MDP9827095.1 putative MnhB-related membrane protein [Kineosporia succinea]
MHLALIKYTAMRVAIFVVVLILLGLVAGRSITTVVLAAVISLALSYLLLQGPRAQLTEAITERTANRLDRRREGLDRSDDEIEDEADEASRSGETGPG